MCYKHNGMALPEYTKALREMNTVPMIRLLLIKPSRLDADSVFMLVVTTLSAF